MATCPVELDQPLSSEQISIGLAGQLWRHRELLAETKRLCRECAEVRRQTQQLLSQLRTNLRSPIPDGWQAGSCEEMPDQHTAPAMPGQHNESAEPGRFGSADNLLNGRKLGDVIQPSPRQREVMILVAHGYANKDIARILSISEQTVKNHLRALFKRLRISDRLELALYTVYHGFHLEVQRLEDWVIAINQREQKRQGKRCARQLVAVSG